ncbi:uncharacterized protein TrAFT101_008883 [Trichoderma asperellum]|uniref:uncharacterized protein n=1 Tax=Trichoderma asperellum TaxID=101201 RepID=UPI003331CE21|nr:hypothetical protein TrAFT101_008883 [Trichoderma asperellum]
MYLSSIANDLIGDMWALREKPQSVDPPLPREAVRHFWPFPSIAHTQVEWPPPRDGRELPHRWRAADGHFL